MSGTNGGGNGIEIDIKTLEHSTLKVPYEVLNKKFRTTQKILDREAAYVCQAGNELDKLLSQFESSSGLSSSSSPEADISASQGSSRDVAPMNIDNDNACSQGPILVESAINVQSIAALLAGVKDQDDGSKDEPMICERADEEEAEAPQQRQNNESEENEREMGDIDGDEGNSNSRKKIILEMDGGSSSAGKGSRSKTGSPVSVNGGRKNVKDVEKLLDVLVERLGSLKRKAEDNIQEELQAADNVRKRVQHLNSFIKDADASRQMGDEDALNAVQKAWKKSRLNRMLIDHLLREGMYDTARRLSEDLQIKELTNVDVFWAAKEVEGSLRRHETVRMVQWCYENKSKLRKIRSTLELEIRVQEFIELVRIGKRHEAVKHARKYLADSEGEEYIAAVKKCMGLLAFPVNTTLAPYAELFSGERWNQLITHFRQEHARLYQLAPNSVLEAAVQAGLAALKTPQCYRSETKNTNCPVCTDPLSSLAQHLPYAHCAHSQLVCAISGEPINENNPPLALPSAFIYGSNALHDMAKNNSGKIICPRSNKVYDISDADKVYVM